MTAQGSGQPLPAPEPEPGDTVWPYIGVGCLTIIVGFFGGGMIAMLIGRIADTATGCRAPEGLPVCGWWKYWWTGGLLGSVILPVAALRRLRRGRRTDESTRTNQGGSGGTR